MLLSGIHIPQACISRIRPLDTRLRGYDNPNHCHARMSLSGIHIPQACISRIRLLDTRLRGYDNPKPYCHARMFLSGIHMPRDCIRATGSWLPASAGMTTQNHTVMPECCYRASTYHRLHPCNRPLDTRLRGYDNQNHTVMPECCYRASTCHRLHPCNRLLDTRLRRYDNRRNNILTYPNNSSYKSRHFGLFFSIRSIFHSLFHFFSFFSRSSAI